ncbi:Uncharacterized protein APZ42_014579 [Daphnia magna]|uniref:Uncharacterized protein n=1 Tax=Daphnia magna TaxID=35525 RepID=A0A162PPY9_9CRUS|nr:Uncharacterized protein APZ42_014579 [Daphnia magna]
MANGHKTLRPSIVPFSLFFFQLFSSLLITQCCPPSWPRTASPRIWH